MAFGKEIRRLREQEKISVNKLAGMIGVNAYRLRKWEEKDFDPRYEDAQLIEKFFKTSIDDIKNLPSLKPFLNVQYSYQDKQKELEEPDYKEKYIRLLEKQNELNLNDIKAMLANSRDMLEALYDKLINNIGENKVSDQNKLEQPKKGG